MKFCILDGFLSMWLPHAVWLIWIMGGLRILSFTGMPTIWGSYTLQYFGVQLQFDKHKIHKKSILLLCFLWNSKETFTFLAHSPWLLKTLWNTQIVFGVLCIWTFSVKVEKKPTQKQTQGHGFMNFHHRCAKLLQFTHYLEQFGFNKIMQAVLF